MNRRLAIAAFICLVSGCIISPVVWGQTPANLLPGLPIRQVSSVVYLPYSDFATESIDSFSIWPSVDFGNSSRRLVFIRDNPDVSLLWYLCVGNPVTGKIIATGLAADFRVPDEPKLGRDERSILFCGGREYDVDGHRGIWLTSTDGMEPVRLTPTNYAATSPAWSPDGKYIAFVKVVETETKLDEIAIRKHSLAIINSKPPYQMVRELTFSKLATHDFDLQWISRLRYSPDGRWLACHIGSSIFNGICIIDIKTGTMYPIFTPLTIALNVPKGETPYLIFFGWLPGSNSLLIQTNHWNYRTYHQAFLVNLKGETRAMGEGFLINSTNDGRFWYIVRDKRVWRVELEMPKESEQTVK